MDIQLVFEMSCAIILNNGKMQMHADGVVWIARIISLIAQECPRFNELLGGARRKFRRDKRIAMLICHMSVVEPNLLTGLKRIVRNADDHGRFPIGEASEISRIDSNDMRLPDRCSGEDIDPLMRVGVTHLITP